MASVAGLHVAVVGCGHGELVKMYESVEHIEKTQNIKIDLLICCGDFQAVRNEDDLECMACPVKYRSMNTFYQYYSGEKVAPVLTIFIGGNHEASNYLLELAHGGWVAPNIYYLGWAGVVNFGGLRIGGLSGIYKSEHFFLGHFERPPFDRGSMRSVYHVREYELFRMMQISQPVDLFLSHDWPGNIARHGNTEALLRQKKFLRREVQDGSLGNLPAERLLQVLQPSYWFSAHLHVKFAAAYRHQSSGRLTRFLALDKCLPHRDFMQVLHFPHAKGPMQLQYDREWLAIMRSTTPLLPICRGPTRMPTINDPSRRYDYRPTAEELAWIDSHFLSLTVPENFTRTVRAYDPQQRQQGRQPGFVTNPQTSQLLGTLELRDVLSETFDMAAGRSMDVVAAPAAADPNEIKLEDGPQDPAEILLESSADEMTPASGTAVPNPDADAEHRTDGADAELGSNILDSNEIVLSDNDE